MPRPTVLHDGFLIPNAKDVSNPRMAEPDRVDFNTLAHPLWGVIEGCAVTVAGVTADVSAGTVLVNGQIVSFAHDTRTLPIASKDRFCLVVVTSGGVLEVIPGEDAVDPVFPDPPLSTTVLAAVFCPASGSDLVNNVIDKRKFVNKALLTKIAPSADLVRNLNGSGNHYLVGGDGRTTWENDTWIWRSAEASLSLHKNLTLEGTLTAGGNANIAGDVTALGTLIGKNLSYGITTPVTPAVGTIWSHSGSGRVSVYRAGAWQELATIASANPPGTVITSLEIPDVMINLGWLPLDGRWIDEGQYPNIFKVQGMAHLIDNGVSPRTMHLPDARKRMLMADFTSAAGTIVAPNPGNKVGLSVNNIPRHGHHPRSSPNGAANPRVTVGINGSHAHDIPFGGPHVHKVTDRGHRHKGMDYAGLGGTAVVALVWGGQNKIDAMFNDRNHTYSVEALEWTAPAYSDISIDTADSIHTHVMVEGGGHDHPAWLEGGIKDHAHDITEDEIGSGASFDITPEHMTLYAYVRT